MYYYNIESITTSVPLHEHFEWFDTMKTRKTRAVIEPRALPRTARSTPHN